jgi:recombination protein RecA
MSTAIEDLIKSTDRAFGRGTLMQADGSVEPGVEVIPTGSFALDRALGIGGLPKGRLATVTGAAAASLAVSCVVQAQKQGGVVAFIDAEKSLNLSHARVLGVDCSRMLLSQPDCGEQAMDVVEALVHSGQCSLIVVNGLGKLSAYPQAGDPPNYTEFPGRLLSRAMRKLAGKAHQTGTTVLFTDTHSLLSHAGSTLKFWSSVRIESSVIGIIKVDDVPVGIRVKYKVLKNKCAVPFKQCEVDVLATGFVREREVFDTAVMQGIITRSGAFYRLGDELVGQGRERAIKEMTQVPELCERIVAALRDDEGEMY